MRLVLSTEEYSEDKVYAYGKYSVDFKNNLKIESLLAPSNFSNAYGARINRIKLTCPGKCISYDGLDEGGSQRYNTTDFFFDVCDEETAHYIILAINALVELNQPSIQPNQRRCVISKQSTAMMTE